MGDVVQRPRSRSVQSGKLLPQLALAASAALALVLRIGDAQGQADARRLSWTRGEGAESCAPASTIEERVKARLGRNPFSDSSARSIEVSLARVEGHWVARLLVRGADGTLGTREFSSTAADCGPLEDATTLAIALAIDPDALLTPPAQPSASAVVPPPPPLPRGSAVGPPPLVAPVQPTTEPKRVNMMLRAGWSSGLLPQTAFGLGWTGQVSLGPRTLLSGSALWLPEVKTTSGEFAFGLTALGAGLCVEALQFERGHLATCALAYGGSLHAVVYQSPNLRPTQPGDWGWAAASALPQLQVQLFPPLALQAGLEMFVPILRRPYTVAGRPDPVFRQSAVTFFGFVSLGAAF